MERAVASDADLIDASRRGERDAFGVLVERYARMVEAVSYAGTRDRALGEEIAQETFVAAWRDLDRLRDTSAVRSWLCGIARNLARKERRRRGREVVAPSPDAAAPGTPFDAVHDGEAERLVAAALERIPDAYREALVLFYYEQRSTRDVAEALGVSEEAVHQRLSRGRRFVAAELEASVERVLEGRRSRRNLAACVLGALPVALVTAPSHAEAATKGSSMWKLGALGILAATSVAATTVLAWPRDDASGAAGAHAPDPVAVTGAAATNHPAAPIPGLPRAARTTAAAAPAPRTAAAATPPIDCAAVARHMVDLATAEAPPPTSVPATASEQTSRLIASQFEQLCHEARWSASTLACVMAADDMWNAMMCKGASVLPAPTALAAPGTDISCAAVAAHAFAITLDSFGPAVPADQRATVEAQRPQVIQMFATMCARDAWSETQRRCAIAATSPFTFGACTQAATPARPTPAPPSSDASCVAVSKHVAALVSQPLSDVDLPGLTADARADLAQNTADLPSQIETACTNGGWSEALRRCMLGCTQPTQLTACQQPR
ncbi:MAG: RNA polymerase sigma factor [Acidobacteriota bacterium]